jgi:hypothetical protein
MTTHSKLRRIIAGACITLLLLPQLSLAQQAVDDSPDPFAMVGDLFVARPIGLVMTVGGTAAWVVSLPFTLLSGHVGEAAETLILGPGETTFVRCLGCRDPGYTHKDIDSYRARQEAKTQQDALAATDA